MGIRKGERHLPTVTKVFYPPAFPQEKRVGIYCRVSSKHEEQLSSLSSQVSYFTKMVGRQPRWRLTDIYIDIKSGETISARAEFNRLLDDCRRGVIDMVVTRSICRFGRDTVDLLTTIRELRSLGIGVLFDAEKISTLEHDSELITTIIEAYAQAENESRSANTKKGLVMRAKNGTSGLYKRRCFGYTTDSEGDLQINNEEAAVVRSIFDMYIGGESLVGIITALDADGVKTANGKDRWSKNTLDKLLSNEKYCGDVILFKSFTSVQHDPVKSKKRKENRGDIERYVCMENHPAIISKEVFEAVQAEKKRRSNVEVSEGGVKRKSTRYSKKRDSVLA